MAAFQINPAETDAVLTELFFYVKGSNDYPSSQLITKPFGYATGDDSQENPIFQTSIAELFKKLHNPRVVDNLYSLESDTQNGIDSIESASKNKNLRNDRAKEYISSFIINNGDPTDSEATNKYSDHIDPNYVLDTTVNISNFDPSKEVNNVTNYEHVFWQKMFSLIEFLKKYERTIISDDLNKSKNPEWVNVGNRNDAWWSEAKYDTLLNNLSKETTIGKYIALFVGNSSVFSTGKESFDTRKNFELNESGEVTSFVPFNPIRTEALYGTSTLLTTNEEKYEEYLWQKECLDITYIPKSASFTISDASSSIDPRIGSMEFQIKYRYSATSYQNVLLRVYFSPDEMVSSSVYSSLKVYTYNDTNLDGKYAAGFNRYDNDYSNLLSDNENVKNNFIVSNREVEENIIDMIENIYKTGSYSGHVKFSTKRVTPTISASGLDIEWLDENSTNQNFYIFYNGTEPSISEQMSAVQDYLKNLHGSCSPTVYNDDGTIKHIGHTDSSKLEFLALMYPELFTSVNVHIIPIGVNMYNNNGSSYPVGGSYDPTKYYHTITPQRIYETIRSYSLFRNFKLNESGNVVLTEQSESQVYLPAEVLYTGGINSIPSEDTGDIITYDFPWIATCRGEQTTLPLTSRTGFADYRQRWFQGSVNYSQMSDADKLQYIICQLTLDMFVEDKANFLRRNSIAGVPIDYNDNASDENGTSNIANEVTFTISSVKFTVHAQIGKHFGYMSSGKRD